MRLVIIVAYAIAACMCGGMISINLPKDSGLSFCNPHVIHKHMRVNWFGAYFLGMSATFVCLPVSVPYWMYKLCTTGRKKDDNT